MNPRTSPGEHRTPASTKHAGPPSGKACTALGVGAAGLLAGGVLTRLWVSAKHGGDAACGVPDACDAATANQWETKQRNFTIGLAAGFGVAAIGGGIGLALALVRKPAANAARGVTMGQGVRSVRPGVRGLEVRF
jgi:hypothetical protein